MINSLFEIYDPYTFVFDLSLNWFPISLVLFLFISEFWCLNSFYTAGFSLVLTFLVGEFGNFYHYKKMKTSMILFVSLFFFILFVNILGLVPYVFACSSHFVFSVSLGFPIWLSMLFLGWLKLSNSMFIHLIPMGTPLVLISFMALIETISNLIRPWSLSIRLMSNMISGHLLMSLLGDCGFYLIFLQLGLFIFEFFVCFIQAFVFSALLTLYSGEV
uniref:ATP synthase subunit a n=1 Tax=Bemisia afer TaxID=166114 RepID=A0A023IZ72_BEMAF|nr:ATP synthase F0 subunit 6 [Bemisia afer]AHC02241.1 ATP synthase F0 subunit 6 [Bemisia afer]